MPFKELLQMSEDKKKSVMSVVIYGAVLFAVAALLVVMSLIINVKHTNRLENQIDKTEQGAATAQTTLVNVQQENKTLRELLASANTRNENMKKYVAIVEERIAQAEARSEALALLAQANTHVLNSKYTKAREVFETIDVTALTAEDMEAYERLQKRLY